MERYYTKTIDNVDRHDVTVDEKDNIINSSIVCQNGGFYTREKEINSKFIGKGKNFLRGKGFKKVKGPSIWYENLKQWRNFKQEEQMEFDADE